jgi:hypothetical protein
MSLDERSYPTPPLSAVTRFTRKVVKVLEDYWKDRFIRRMRQASRPVSTLRSRPA